MRIDGVSWKSIWLDENCNSISVIDQTKLPYDFQIKTLKNSLEAYDAIKTMVVRGAPLIGVTGAYGFLLGIKEDPSDLSVKKHMELLNSARPTAVNLSWALNRLHKRIKDLDTRLRFQYALKEAKEIEKEDVNMCSLIGDYGMSLIENIAEQKLLETGIKKVNILTHCNAGWLAAVDWGTALSPIYKAFRAGIDLHVWVDETRPRNQGASLTAFELKGEGIPHTVIVDNAGGYLMQRKEVDLVIVGSDRTTSSGDVCNKIGTYLKALAAKDCKIPFYVALPVSTIDWELNSGLKEIDIETRSPDEVTYINGLNDSGNVDRLRLIPIGSSSFNPGFDITPAHLVTGLITERGITPATYEGLQKLYQL